MIQSSLILKVNMTLIIFLKERKKIFYLADRNKHFKEIFFSILILKNF